jgi:hypothetical protein
MGQLLRMSVYRAGCGADLLGVAGGLPQGVDDRFDGVQVFLSEPGMR